MKGQVKELNPQSWAGRVPLAWLFQSRYRLGRDEKGKEGKGGEGRKEFGPR